METTDKTIVIGTAHRLKHLREMLACFSDDAPIHGGVRLSYRHPSYSGGEIVVDVPPDEEHED